MLIGQYCQFDTFKIIWDHVMYEYDVWVVSLQTTNHKRFCAGLIKYSWVMHSDLKTEDLSFQDWSSSELVSSSDLEKCSIISLAHQWMWMGAVRMRVQTADKNITIIHTTPVHQSMSMTFIFTGESNIMDYGLILWPTFEVKICFNIMDSYFSWKQWLEVKNILMMDLFLTDRQPFSFLRH